MTKRQIEERERIINAISLEANCSIEKATKIAKHLKRVNTQLNWWNEAYCDSDRYFRYWNEEGENELLDKIEKQVTEYVTKNIGCKMYINHDPRGHAVRLYLKSYHNVIDQTTAMVW